MRPRNGARLDQPAHRGAVAGQVALDLVGGVRVRVEMDDADIAVAMHIGDSGGRRPRDGMVTAQDHRHDATLGQGVHPFPDVVVGHLGLAVRTIGVAEVDDLEPVEDLQAEIHVVGARLIGGRPDRPRAEPGSRTVGGPDVERCTHDGGVRFPLVELCHLGQKRTMPERGQPRIGEVELLGHSRRDLAAVIVVMTHGHDRTAQRVPEPLNAARIESGIGRFAQSSVDTTT